jgi:hypothetical protein
MTSPEETNQDPAPLKHSDAERDTTEQAEQASDRPTESDEADDSSEKPSE